MQVHLEYGRTGLEVELPDRNVVGCLQYRPAEPLADAEAAVRRCLAEPTGTPPLARAGPRPPQCVRGDLRCDPARAECGAAAADSGNARSGRHSPP